MPRWLGCMLLASSLCASVAYADDEDAPITVGQMSEEAAAATRLFRDEKWAEAAMALERVASGKTADDAGNQQIAEYHLAIALYRLQLFQTSFLHFRKIASKPTHQRFENALLWLAKLDTQLPEPAGVIGALRHYRRRHIKSLDNEQQRPVYHQLSYLLGRYKYGERELKEAAALFAAVGRDSPYYVKAQFFLGITHVELRKSVPAVKAFQRILDALEDGVEGVEDEQRMRDLAYLSLARLFYSASVEVDDEGVGSINELKLSRAVAFWNKVDVDSEYWLDALFEQSWAYYMAGDFPRALGNIHTLQSPYFPNAFYPEADVVRMVIYYTTCQYDDATALVAKFQRRYEPVERDLRDVLEATGGSPEKSYRLLLQVREGGGSLRPMTRIIVERLFDDRQLLRELEQVKVIDMERARFAAAPKPFIASPLGSGIDTDLDDSRKDAIRRTGMLARRRYQRALDDLHEQLRNSQKIIVDITKAHRDKLEAKIADKWTPEDAFKFGRVDPDDEHVIWPFDGEYWRDELGFYRQVVNSGCGSGTP